MKKNNSLKRLTASVLFLIMTFSFLSAQDQMTVRGKIVDDQNEPMIGVSVLEKGTSNGVTTDLDGNYQLSARQGSTLVFSYIGYVSQEHTVTGSTLNITMKEDVQALDEVVVVGYGVQKKSSLTGAVSSVKSEDMEARTITRAEQALQGKTAGVQVLSASAKPGASPSVRIRGVSSNGSSDPLYVVDGRIANDIGGIDPNDIESMEVLKDGASAAIYGAAAGNGVVLITTKKGSGSGKITYDFQYTSQSLGRTPKVMNAQQYKDYFIEAGKIAESAFDIYWDGETDTKWTDVAFEKSSMMRHNVTYQGGGDTGSFYLSASHLKNNGMVVGDADTYERLTGMVNASRKIKPWLEVGTNNQIEHYKTQSVAEGSEYGSLLLSVLQLDPLTQPLYSINNLPPHMESAYAQHPNMLGDGQGNLYGISAFTGNAEAINPLAMRDRAFTKYRGFNINGSTYLNFTPIKDFVFTSRLGYRLSSTSSYGVSHDYYYHGTAKQDYIQVDASDESPTYWQWENFLNYSRAFGKHNTSVMLGTSYSESRTFEVSGNKRGDDQNLGFLQDDPLFWYFAYATSDAAKDISGGEESYTRKLAYFGRLNYDYESKYLAQVSLRADAADLSVLPRAKRWGYFPAASVGWVISHEEFMQNTQKWLSHLKLRASWGQNGSTASLGNYLWNVSVGSTGHLAVGDNNSFYYINGYAPSATGNEQLKWETSEQTNIGVDARFLNNRLSVSADYFNKETKDLIVSDIKASTVVGNTFSPVNAGNIINRGVELEVGWQDRIGNFSYGIRGNMATLKNKVTHIHESLAAIDGATLVTYGAITRFEVGKPAWYFYGYKYTGVDKATGEPVFEDQDGDNVITDNDKTEIGKGIADFTYGVTLTAGWKNIDFILFGTGSQGNDVYSGLNRVDYNLNQLTYFTENRWTASNPNGTTPRAYATDYTKYMTSSGSVFDGSYFKIKQIQMGYSFPKNLLKKAAIESLRVYGSLEDFFTFTRYPGFDPEVTGTGNALGVDKGSYPTSKKMVLGLTLTF
ncbi:TonB-dependent receptor [Proteiniphilum sp. X52]|uniref:SusC/RagA family TonB-linked outer membrane protein n=1 Tax=Proteiniphilum sp. X52 TaxID=2382159 RepID=UPI000F09D036|nr:TonB-dependent receptor [Proteiniphilum sp. X52]RNC66424.1 TonB-dependent receptor [Proteiniphilum sp. X52]